LRNSFLVVEEKWKRRIYRLGLSLDDLFLDEHTLMKKLVEQQAAKPITLNGTFSAAEAVYDRVLEQAAGIDPTLAKHVAALRARSLNHLKELEKKMLRAEKRKYGDQHRQVQSLLSALFPGTGLQERVDNYFYYHALMGPSFLDLILEHSGALEQQFTVLLHAD
ncbi:MAG TPA: bacillithiol biosynthesis BshC, partial [Chitinophagaceae bacterium]|nr:bacillithiol biosynthesis BshC [Chitinophagaceae bacterium]